MRPLACWIASSSTTRGSSANSAGARQRVGRAEQRGEHEHRRGPGPGEGQADRQRGLHERRDEQDAPRVEAVDEHPGRPGEHDRRRPHRDEERRDREARPGLVLEQQRERDQREEVPERGEADGAGERMVAGRFIAPPPSRATVRAPCGQRHACVLGLAARHGEQALERVRRPQAVVLELVRLPRPRAADQVRGGQRERRVDVDVLEVDRGDDRDLVGARGGRGRRARASRPSRRAGRATSASGRRPGSSSNSHGKIISPGRLGPPRLGAIRCAAQRVASCSA